MPPPSAGGSEPTCGIWPQLAEALRLAAVGLDATNESPQRVRARWSVTVTITDIQLLRRRTASPDLPDPTWLISGEQLLGGDPDDFERSADA